MWAEGTHLRGHEDRCLPSRCGAHVLPPEGSTSALTWEWVLLAKACLRAASPQPSLCPGASTLETPGCGVPGMTAAAMYRALSVRLTLGRHLLARGPSISLGR